jgi:hypothetical protein
LAPAGFDAVRYEYAITVRIIVFPVIKSQKWSLRQGLALLLCSPSEQASFADIYRKVYS